MSRVHSERHRTDRISWLRAAVLKDLATIYIQRGVKPSLAREVAAQLMASDAVGAHARDELGISEPLIARPFNAAVTSALSFSLGAAVPLVLVALTPQAQHALVIACSALITLASLGALSAKLGGAKVRPAMVRVSFWGLFAMAMTSAVGALFGTAA